MSPLYAVQNPLPREWCCPEWAGLPTSTKAIKLIPTDIFASHLILGIEHLNAVCVRVTDFLPYLAKKKKMDRRVLSKD